MATRKKTGRKRRSTRRTATKRVARRPGRTSQRPELGPNLRRLIQGKVLSANCAKALSTMTLNRIEGLSGREVGTLIEVRSQVGPLPINCCLI